MLLTADILVMAPGMVSPGLHRVVAEVFTRCRLQTLERFLANGFRLPLFGPHQLPFVHVHQAGIFGLLWQGALLALAADYFRREPVPANGDGVAALQAGPASTAHRLGAAVDVGAATAVDQAEHAVQEANFGMARHGAGTMGRQLPGVATSAAD